MSGFNTMYRPKQLGDIWGNQETVRTLEAMFAKDKPPQTFLFSGERGCGKTTTARAAALELGVLPENIEEVNIASQRNIDDARALIAGLEYPPISGKRAYILDECHKANDFWSDSMLKSLEDVPDWAFFFLCTTDPGKLKKTVRSRCQEFMFAPLSNRVLNRELNTLNTKHELGLSEDIISRVVECGNGVPREVLGMLEKVYCAVPSDRDSILSTLKPTEDSENLVQALLKKEYLTALKALEQNKVRGEEAIRRGVIGYLSKILGNPKGPQFKRAYEVFYSFKEPFYDSGWPGLVYACCEAVYGG